MNSKFFINRKSFSARVALILTALAIPFIIVGRYSLLFNFAFNNIPLVTEVILPLIGSIMFIIVLLLLGRAFFAISFLPVVLCMIPIILQALKSGNIVGIGEVVICFLAIILYSCTVFGAIKIKIIPILVFVLEICYRLFFYIYKNVASGVSFGVQNAFYHVAMLYLLTAFLFALIGLDKKIKVTASGKDVIPPIPGSNSLGQATAPVFSDPAPDANDGNEDTEANLNYPEPLMIPNSGKINSLNEKTAENIEITDNSAAEQTDTVNNTSRNIPFDLTPNEEPADSIQQGIRNTAEKIKSIFAKKKEKEPEQPHDIEKGAEEIGQIEEQ